MSVEADVSLQEFIEKIKQDAIEKAKKAPGSLPGKVAIEGRVRRAGGFCCTWGCCFAVMRVPCCSSAHYRMGDASRELNVSVWTLNGLKVGTP